MTNRTLSKAEKKAIMDKHPSAPASEIYTDEEWAKLMFATHSEVKDLMQGIKLIDVATHTEQEVIVEINKLVWILIERYNDKVGNGWDEDDKTYSNNNALDQEEGDDYDLVNDVVVSYSDNELSENDDDSKWENVWDFTSADEGWTINHTVITEDGDDVSNETDVYGDYEVAYWWVLGAYEQKWLPTDRII
jgi:hypothetical protein